VNRGELERWLYGSGPGQRRTQDSPILPDVWYVYSLPPEKLESERTPDSPLVRSPKRRRPARPARDKPAWEADLLLRPTEAASSSELAQALGARLDRPRDQTLLAFNDAYVACRLTFEELVHDALPLTRFWYELWPGNPGVLKELLRGRQGELTAAFEPTPARDPGITRHQGRRPVRPGDIPGNLIWLVGLVGRIAWEHSASKEELPTARQVVNAALKLLGDLEIGKQADTPLWRVSRNRPVEASVWKSRIACKADAATTLFGLSCKDIRWAVIDSGVDARHPAFARRNADQPVVTTGFDTVQSANSRVVGTWDFARIRSELAKLPLDDEVETGVARGRAVDWEEIAPTLEIKHDDTYDPPADDHGTHVAGILASDWRAFDNPSPGENHVQGMCPDIEIYDLRAFGASGSSDEFQILSAMQFVRHLNAHSDRRLVHGVNLSFSVRHEVDKYAAGQTPVCEEAHRLVGSGVVVVAAAGNDGRGGYVVRGRNVEGYRAISITDPGNAEKVITVGATHRDQPHTYGVSYFSSRGPTGDGRAKPDLVAPGERITSPIPDAGLQSKDGTSQAAPHVSGACALLMARHPELMGQPERVKKVLVSTCTDLGREHAFQGAGIVDVLRAIQAV
jgi:hypothetical protein